MTKQMERMPMVQVCTACQITAAATMPVNCLTPDVPCPRTTLQLSATISSARTVKTMPHPPALSRCEVPVPPQYHITAREWPLRSSLVLGALPTAVPCARLHTRHVLWEWGMLELSESTELVVSELMTNALAASRSLDSIFPVRLWLLSDNKQILILIWDANPNPPRRVEPEGHSEGGRGLMLVEAISKSWDWYATPDMIEGKVIWALISP